MTTTSNWYGLPFEAESAFPLDILKPSLVHLPVMSCRNSCWGWGLDWAVL